MKLRQLGSAADRRSGPVVVASNPFGESYLLSEMFAQLLEAHGITVTRRPGLGATDVAFAALRRGAIDVYPEYTGTGLLVILHDSVTDSLAREPSWRAKAATLSRGSRQISLNVRTGFPGLAKRIVYTCARFAPSPQPCSTR
ncbi:MAG: glycine betaine ABC transporter substrate-binding protein, partial [Gemmatimonadaceae bacterium]